MFFFLKKKSSEVFQELRKKAFELPNKDNIKKDLEKLKAPNNSLKKVVDKTKELLKTIEKYDKNKKYTSADEVLKMLNARAEDDRKV